MTLIERAVGRHVQDLDQSIARSTDVAREEEPSWVGQLTFSVNPAMTAVDRALGTVGRSTDSLARTFLDPTWNCLGVSSSPYK